MKTKGKKILAITTILVFSFGVLITPVTAKERRGANVEIYKTNPEMEGTPWQRPDIKGELIAVKENSLLVLDSEGADITVNISEIEFLIINKKSAAKWGFLSGFLVGGGLMGTYLGLWAHEEKGNVGLAATIGGLGGGFVFGFLGSIIAGIVAPDKTIQIEGKHETEIKAVLDKLRSKSRVPDYN